MNLGDVEPFFAELFIYDEAADIITSERFYFDCNASDGLVLLPPGSLEGRDSIATSRQCIFNVKQPSSSLYLVLHISKVFFFALLICSILSDCLWGP